MVIPWPWRIHGPSMPDDPEDVTYQPDQLGIHMTPAILPEEAEGIGFAIAFEVTEKAQGRAKDGPEFDQAFAVEGRITAEDDMGCVVVSEKSAGSR